MPWPSGTARFILVGWSCALRRSELALLKTVNAAIVGEKVLVSLESSKTDQEARARRLGRTGRGRATEPQSLRSGSGSRFSAAGSTCFTARAARRIVGSTAMSGCRTRGRRRREALDVGSEDRAVRVRFGWSAHSLRAGFVTEAARQGWPELEDNGAHATQRF